MKCIKCHSTLSDLKTIEMTGTFRKAKVTVSVTGRECPSCGYKMVEGRHLADYMVAVADAYRRQAGLLTAAEIRKGREVLRMSQEQFAQYLGVGVATIKRLESGDVQSVATDRLIRLCTDHVYALQRAQELARRVAAQGPSHEDVCVASAANTQLALAA